MCLAIVEDERRPVVEIAEVQSTTAILSDIHVVHFLSEARADRLAFGPLLFDSGRRLVAAPDQLNAKLGDEA